MSDVNESNAKNLQEYYNGEAIRAAENLGKIIRQRNNIPEIPKKFNDIQPMPVFEIDTFNLVQYTEEIDESQTTVTFVKASAPSIPAYYKRYIKGSKLNEIVITVGQNYCVKRFYAAKELMHPHLTNIDMAATNTADGMDQLMEELLIEQTNKQLSIPTLVDKAAYYGAMVYLIPECWLPALQKLREHLIMNFPNDAPKAYFQIAQIIRVPESMVKFRLESFKGN